jgi:TolB-like protein/DNA-binding winged helix-turn-helix (wHTH) protein/Tfp pilus assembly protein PilF
VSTVRFGPYEFDPSVPALRRRGRRVHLQEMPLRALEILLDRPNELVTRETFFTQLWPDDESGILDDNLNTAMRKLRLALNDSAHAPHYIETVPKRGYRFIAPVTRDGSPAGHAATAPAPASSRHARAAVLAAAFVLAAIAGGLMLLPRQATSPVAEPAPARVETLAVLPFANASNDAADEYFSAGLTEELTDRLARSEHLRVVSRTSAFAVQDEDLDAREIGKLLGADALVEGSVRRDGDRLRISVHLVDAGNGYQLWTQTYDRRIEDVFAVQEDIALSVANTLLGRLLNAGEAEALAAPETDPVAYDLYLKGRFYWHRRTADGLHASVRHFEEAVERAPDYAPAWVGLADAYAVLGFYDYLAPEDAFPRARETALRALELDPENASAYATLGYAALYYDWNLEEAEAHFRRSIALRPTYSKAHQWYGNLLTAAGRFPEAELEMRRAQQLDPLSLIANAALGWTWYHAGRHDEALAQYELTLGLDPEFELAYLWSGWALEALGRYDEAVEMVKESIERSGGSGISVASLARLHALRGERAEAERVLSELIASDRYVPAYEIAKAWYALGDPVQAHAWMERALEQRSHSLVFLRVDPQLADVRENEAFILLARRVASDR